MVFFGSGTVAKWTFDDGTANDVIVSMHGTLMGGATIVGGRLILNGTNAWVVTEPLPFNLREKTLEVWVALDGRDQKGGGALTVQTPDSEHFDSIVFGERETARWIAGSDFISRTQDVGGPAEIAYHAQVGPAYAAFGVQRPALVPRPGATLLEPAQVRALEAEGLERARAPAGARRPADPLGARVGKTSNGPPKLTY